jgi:hypothetical protein
LHGEASLNCKYGSAPGWGGGFQLGPWLVDPALHRLLPHPCNQDLPKKHYTDETDEGLDLPHQLNTRTSEDEVYDTYIFKESNGTMFPNQDVQVVFSRQCCTNMQGPRKQSLTSESKNVSTRASGISGQFLKIRGRLGSP